MPKFVRYAADGIVTLYVIVFLVSFPKLLDIFYLSDRLVNVKKKRQPSVYDAAFWVDDKRIPMMRVTTKQLLKLLSSGKIFMATGPALSHTVKNNIIDL